MMCHKIKYANSATINTNSDEISSLAALHEGPSQERFREGGKVKGDLSAKFLEVMDGVRYNLSLSTWEFPFRDGKNGCVYFNLPSVSLDIRSQKAFLVSQVIIIRHVE